jgi:N-acetyl-beta-hexosaminidase
MTINKDKVEVISSGEAGLFYGCQTLEQLLEDARDFNKPVPSCKITDYPVLSYRAVHFDLKHHLDHMNYYYESIDRLARYKINAVVVEFEDKLRYRRQPLVGAPQSISIDEMAALTRYARERHIEITPLVQGLGHATFILKHEEYAVLRELPWNKWAFCPLNEGTYQILFDMYRDAIDATPGSKYLHIGGDANRWPIRKVC